MKDGHLESTPPGGTTFRKESEFEDALVKVLSGKGWEQNVLLYCTEKELIRNWAGILYENNREIDRLNDCPLTDGEMQQILDQITTLRTPLKLNSFINGKTVPVVRDNPDDRLHFGKEIHLKIYDRREIAAGQSRYQIVRQPKFPAMSKMQNDRRGDLMLLINGMPVIHIELKRSGVPVSQAYNQIEKYAHEGVFTGLFSLVQVFVAMNPDEAVYFANPGPDGKFNPDYYFHWADFKNNPINGWKTVASSLLSIPMAHQLIGFYTVADNSDGVLKVMRSYQYYAANAISDKVSKIKWDGGSQLGGYVWHTTGSGKTMTSFKSAQLIADGGDADKVVFLTDRIELGTQSLKEYRSFADDGESVQATESTAVLVTKLKSGNSADTLIVTSIQKMSNIRNEEGGLNARDIELINKKRIVFIVDEAHRSTFGDMLITIKHTFPGAVFFGFTGTPIRDVNSKKMNTTTTVFGNELHSYTIADGIRDRNVLGFDPYKVLTFRDRDVRRAVALSIVKAGSEEEAIADEEKKKIYYRYTNTNEIPMGSYRDGNGELVKGIEYFLPNSQYLTEGHQNKVVEDIKDNWTRLSRNGKFHAIFATSSIPEAIEYYRLIKKEMPSLKSSCLFDPTIGNEDGAYRTEFRGQSAAFFKEDGLKEIMEDYNRLYGQNFGFPDHAAFKKDLSFRLAHKEQYKFIDRTPEKQLDLLIVVDQMLTGFDSKWVNTLYMDKTLEYENIIQAFSRTNRLFGPDKPFGTIRYYRRPHTMEKSIEAAVDLYSGGRPLELFVDKLRENIARMNAIYKEIAVLFTDAGVSGFKDLPADVPARAKFASLFRDLHRRYEAARIQGFCWDGPESGGKSAEIKADFDKNTFDALKQRYKELARSGGNGGGGDGDGDIPYDIDAYLTEIDTGVIDTRYMNSRFEKYIELMKQDGASEEAVEQVLGELHNTFASLSQEEQKYADIFLHDVQRGDVTVESGKTFRDYITEYMHRARNGRIRRFAETFGLDEGRLRNMTDLSLTEADINEFGRLDELKASVDKCKARAYFERAEGAPVPPFKVSIKTDRLIRRFILSGGQDWE